MYMPAALLAGIGAVQPGQGLHAFHAAEFLINVHGAELWLVKAGLELVGNDHDLVRIRIKCLANFPAF